MSWKSWLLYDQEDITQSTAGQSLPRYEVDENCEADQNASLPISGHFLHRHLYVKWYGESKYGVSVATGKYGGIGFKQSVCYVCASYYHHHLSDLTLTIVASHSFSRLIDTNSTGSIVLSKLKVHKTCVVEIDFHTPIRTLTMLC